MSKPDLTPFEKAAVLSEALPFIRRFWGSTVVVKYGGNAMESPDKAKVFAQDVALLHSVGMNVVVVHGGGPQIGEMMQRLGKVPAFHDGLRVTDSETLDIARMVLVGKVNRSIVSAINIHGQIAVGVSGEDGAMLMARQRSQSLGFVGDITAVRPELLRRLMAEDLVPVVATIGVDEQGQAYNINADTAAGAIAKALVADKLVYLTDVDGLRDDPGDAATHVSRVTRATVVDMITDGRISGGMIPKMESALEALVSGVKQVHILNGTLDHSLLLEIYTEKGIGTMVVDSLETTGA